MKTKTFPDLVPASVLTHFPQKFRAAYERQEGGWLVFSPTLYPLFPIGATIRKSPDTHHWQNLSARYGRHPGRRRPSVRHSRRARSSEYRYTPGPFVCGTAHAHACMRTLGKDDEWL